MIKRYHQNEIEQLAKILRNDGVISVPTDTVYGICARINSEKAYNKLMAIKKRPKNKLLPIMCANKQQIKDITVVDKRAEKIINAQMPGPITLVLERNPELNLFADNNYDTVAIRMATSNVLKELIEETGMPVFMSSANQSGEPPCANLEEIENFCPDLDGMMEGNIKFGVSSTIVDCTSKEIKILREGPISLEQILKCLD